MNLLRGILSFLIIISFAVIGFDWSLTGNAPLPGGGTTAIDLTEMYGIIGKWMSSLTSYAWWLIMLSLIGFLMTFLPVRKLLPV